MRVQKNLLYDYSNREFFNPAITYQNPATVYQTSGIELK